MAGFQSAIRNLQSTMPPIDLPTLRARAAAIAEKFSDPPALLAAVHSLLEDYADRSHRASPKLTDSSPQNTLKTPMPVVRAVITARTTGMGVFSTFWGALSVSLGLARCDRSA